MTTILLIGGADTSRAPMAAALLRRLLGQRGHRWDVGSAGVLGHDGEPAELQARETMTHMGLSLDDHQARSLTDDLVEGAALLLAIDSGTALVVRARFPAAAARTHALGALAARQRDIPDPFRMQIGAWITYAREIAALLDAALPRIVELMPADSPAAGAPAGQFADNSATQAGPADDARRTAAERIERLLRTIADLPGVVDWPAARERVEADLTTIAATPRDQADLAAAYVGLVRAALAMTPAAPSAGQIAALRDAIARLNRSVGQPDLNELSARLGGWGAL
jgi:protein-tyrosine-phosphatase